MTATDAELREKMLTMFTLKTSELGHMSGNQVSNLGREGSGPVQPVSNSEQNALDKSCIYFGRHFHKHKPVVTNSGRVDRAVSF